MHACLQAEGESSKDRLEKGTPFPRLGFRASWRMYGCSSLDTKKFTGLLKLVLVHGHWENRNPSGIGTMANAQACRVECQCG